MLSWKKKKIQSYNLIQYLSKKTIINLILQRKLPSKLLEQTFIKILQFFFFYWKKSFHRNNLVMLRKQIWNAKSIVQSSYVGVWIKLYFGIWKVGSSSYRLQIDTCFLTEEPQLSFYNFYGKVSWTFPF